MQTNKGFESWIPWIVLAAVIIVALLFVDFDTQPTGNNQAAQEQIESFVEQEESVFNIDSEEEFDVQVDETKDEFVE